MAGLVDFWNEGAAARLRKALQDKGLSVDGLAEVLEVDPRTVRNWITTKRPPTTPSVATLPRLCEATGVTLDEFRAAGEEHARKSREELAPSPELPAKERRRLSRSVMLVTAGCVVLAILILVVTWPTPGGRPAPVVNSFSIPSADDNYEDAWAGRVSPDGRTVAFMAVSREPGKLDVPPRRLYYLSTERHAPAVPIHGSESVFTSFFWAADGNGLYFIRSKKLIYISIRGGPGKEIADVEGGTAGDANAAGEVVLGSRNGLVFVRPDGRVERRASPSAQFFPKFLPDGQRFLFIEQRRDSRGSVRRDLYLMSLRDRKPKLVETNMPSRVEYSRGHVLYVRDCALMARPFDLDTEKLGTEEYKIKDGVWMEDLSGSASFSTSPDGVLVTQAPPDVSPIQQVRLTARGIERMPLPAITTVKNIAMLPGGDELIVARSDRCKQTQSLWRWRRSGSAPVCLTCGRGPSSSPVLSPDGRTVYFAGRRGDVTGIYSLTVDRPADERLVFASPHFPAPRALTPDGSQLVIQMTENRDGNLWTIALNGSATATPAVNTPEMEGESGRFSPDGRWFAFSAAREAGGGIFAVRTGRPLTEARLVGPRGWRCRWSDDGTKLYFAAGRAVMEYDFARDSTRTLFEQDANVTEFAAISDDTFYVVTTAESHNRVDGDWTRAQPRNARAGSQKTAKNRENRHAAPSLHSTG